MRYRRSLLGPNGARLIWMMGLLDGSSERAPRNDAADEAARAGTHELHGAFGVDQAAGRDGQSGEPAPRWQKQMRLSMC